MIQSINYYYFNFSFQLFNVVFVLIFVSFSINSYVIYVTLDFSCIEI